MLEEVFHDWPFKRLLPRAVNRQESGRNPG